MMKKWLIRRYVAWLDEHMSDVGRCIAAHPDEQHFWCRLLQIKHWWWWYVVRPVMNRIATKDEIWGSVMEDVE